MARTKTQTTTADQPLGSQTPSHDKEGVMTRTTILIPQAVDQNLEVYALNAKTSKGDVITKLLVSFLRQNGFQPDKIPKEIRPVYD